MIKNNQGEAVITLDTFLQVQTIMAQRRLKRFHLSPKAAHRHWMPLSGMLFCGNCGSRLTVGITRNRIYYRCPNIALHKNSLCAPSRIAESITRYHVIGLKEAVYQFFRFFFADTADLTDNLYKKYLRKKITDEEYLFLLKNTLNKITVYAENVIFDTKFGIFERKRKVIKRKKGVSCKFTPADC